MEVRFYDLKAQEVARCEDVLAPLGRMAGSASFVLGDGHVLWGVELWHQRAYLTLLAMQP